MEDIKVFRVDITISEYSQKDDGFWNVKENMETAKGKEKILNTLENVYFNTVKYIDKRFK